MINQLFEFIIYSKAINKNSMRKSRFRELFSGTLPQLVAVLSATVSTVPSGMQYAWSAPMIPLLREKNSPVKMSKTEENWLETIILIGGLTGVPMTIFLVEKIGRKYSILFDAGISLISWIITAVATRSEMLYVARFLTGLVGNVAFVSCPMYIAEIAEPKIRGFFATFIYLMMLVGIVLIYSIGPYVSLLVSSIVGASFVIIQLVTFPFMPESPYYLISKNRIDSATKSLKRLRVGTNVAEELEEIKLAIERQKQEKGRTRDLFLIKSNRKALIIMSVLNAAQHFSGISVLIMNMHPILAHAGSIYLEYKTAAIVFAVLLLTAACCASLAIDRFGRKILLVTSSILSGLSMLSLAVYFHLQFLNYDVLAVSWIPIVSVMSYAIVFKLGLGLVPIVLTAELFSIQMKAMGMAVADAMFFFWALGSIYIYQYMSETFSMHLPFYIFSSSCIFTSGFTILYIPETKGKSLEEIQLMLKDHSID